MIGLLIKDVLTVKKYARTMALLVVIYSVWGYMTDNPMFMASFITIFFSMVCVTSISYDENAHWNTYALTMPINRNTLVLSKYVLGILFILGGALVSLLLSFCMAAISGIPEGTILDFVETLLITLASSMFIGLIFIVFYLPFVFWLGIEKSRVIMVAIFLVPSILVMLLYKAAPQLVTGLLGSLSGLEKSPFLLLLIPVIALVMLAISYFISLSIVKKKEF